MKLITRQLVLKKLAITFPDPLEAEKARQSLDRYSKNPSEPLAAAVHLAIIKLSEGRLYRVRELVQDARRDFRDVLYPAQGPEHFQRVRRIRASGASVSEKQSPAEAAAMAKRDQEQWIAWLSS